MKLDKESKLLIATGNQGKYLEYVSLLSNFPVQLVSLKGFDLDEPEENGQTFEENAIIKAQYYSKKTGIDCIADDSGLCIEALSNQPGIYSARWAGEEKDFVYAMQKIYRLLQEKGIDPEVDNIPAYFYCAISLAIKGEEVKVFSGRVDGCIKFPMQGSAGFGYDPIFWPVGKRCSFAEMSKEEKGLMSHRYFATLELRKFFDKYVV